MPDHFQFFHLDHDECTNIACREKATLTEMWLAMNAKKSLVKQVAFLVYCVRFCQPFAVPKAESGSFARFLQDISLVLRKFVLWFVCS